MIAARTGEDNQERGCVGALSCSFGEVFGRRPNSFVTGLMHLSRHIVELHGPALLAADLDCKRCYRLALAVYQAVQSFLTTWHGFAVAAGPTLARCEVGAATALCEGDAIRKPPA